MIASGIHTVRRVKQSNRHPGKDTVILEGGSVPWFRTDHGELSPGDRLHRIASENDWREVTYDVRDAMTSRQARGDRWREL